MTVEAGTKVKRVIAIGGQVTVDGTVEKGRHGRRCVGRAQQKSHCRRRRRFHRGTVVKGRGAEIRGSITEINGSNLGTFVSSAIEDEAEGWSWVWAVISLAIFFCLLIIAMLVTILVPKPIMVISATIREETLRSSLWGLWP